MEEMYNLENSIITRMQYLFITVLLLLLRKRGRKTRFRVGKNIP